MKRILLTTLTFLSLTLSTYASTTHEFRYSPSDIFNTTANYSTYQDSAFDSTTGMQYWTRKSATRYTQTGVGIAPSTTWTSKSYVYIFIEASSTYLYNQFYVYGSSTLTNISGGSGHDPLLVSTFLVDGHYISQYRLETISNLSFPTFEVNVVGSTGTSGTRIYGFYPSTNATLPMTVNSSSTLVTFMQSFGCPGCAPSLDWIGSLGIQDAPVVTYSTSTCGFYDLGGCIQNAFLYLFAPNQTSVDRLRNLTLASSTPFSYAYDLPVLYNELFNTSTTTDITVSANLHFIPGSTSTITFISPAMINSVPFAPRIKLIITWILWLLVAQTIYYRILRMFSPNSV